MTDLNISYEDGLRLSELNGTLEGLKYQLDHMIASHMGQFASVAILAIVILVAVFWLLHVLYERPFKTEFDKESDLKEMKTPFWTYKVLKPIRTEERTRNRWSYTLDRMVPETCTETLPMEVEWVPMIVPRAVVFGVIPVAIFAVVMAVVYIGLNAGIEMQMADVQGQIDTILAKYGGSP